MHSFEERCQRAHEHENDEHLHEEESQTRLHGTGDDAHCEEQKEGSGTKLEKESERQINERTARATMLSRENRRCSDGLMIQSRRVRLNSVRTVLRCRECRAAYT